MEGASEVFVKVFGDRGRHTRLAHGWTSCRRTRASSCRRSSRSNESPVLPHVLICVGPRCGGERGSMRIRQEFRKEFVRQGIGASVKDTECLCFGCAPTARTSSSIRRASSTAA
jgi:hypothetical protein